MDQKKFNLNSQGLGRTSDAKGTLGGLVDVVDGRGVLFVNLPFPHFFPRSSNGYA